MSVLCKTNQVQCLTLTPFFKGILELQGWTDGMDPDSDWVMSALLVSCPEPRLCYVWPDFSLDICFRMFL